MDYFRDNEEEVLDDMAFNETQGFEPLNALLEDGSFKQEVMPDYCPEPAQLVNINAGAVGADMSYCQTPPGLPTGGSAGSWEGCGVTSASNAL
ncbi:hypothetical protein CORC01_02682 [Colletotrichum orchidophilum]|uniref:Uncharacterized protein n=1 Tax=Colletotrichum orchidophilum TaxID=1209926 RepID=A0A1G4BLE0_9PEZI|nr:uncharacterized protein CORC01_02682 [Colletotrichum orchidophilum]OHF02103.1 hypothetical protein CORC01_02682 [Colletotrichum orchidophilum]